MGPDAATLAVKDMTTMIPRGPSNNETKIKVSLKDWDKLMSNIDCLARRYNKLKEQNNIIRCRLFIAEKRVEAFKIERAVHQTSAMIGQSATRVTTPTTEILDRPLDQTLQAQPVLQIRPLPLVHKPATNPTHPQTLRPNTPPNRNTQPTPRSKLKWAQIMMLNCPDFNKAVPQNLKEKIEKLKKLVV